MKKYLRACLMSFTMFCAIPCPYHKWDDEARPLMTLFLPAVGLEIGLLWTLSAYLVRLIKLPSLLGAALLCAFPYLITGFMHLDGFMDVTDAVKSWRDTEERRRILKDPNCGSFSVISCVLLILISFSLFASAKPDANIFTLIFIPVMSRICSSLAVTLLKPMSSSQYSGEYQKGIKKVHVALLLILFAVAYILAFLILGKYGFCVLAVTAGYLPALGRAYKSLGGMSGDISGYALTIGELCGIAVYALV